MSYVTGYLAAAKSTDRERFRRSSEASWPIFKRLGALALVENWGVDVPEGKITSFPLALKLKDDESVVFSWVVWPDRATCDAAWQAMQTDPEMEGMDMPFDMERMVYGGFETIFTAHVS